MDSLRQYRWMFTENWPQDWQTVVETIRSGRQLTTGDPEQKTQLYLTHQPLSYQSQKLFYAQHNHTRFQIGCEQLLWQEWIQSWLNIPEPENLPPSLLDAAHAVTLKTIHELFTHAGLDHPIALPVKEQRQSITHSPVVLTVRILQPNKPTLVLHLSGLDPEVVKQLAMNMSHLDEDTFEPIELKLSVGFSLQPADFLSQLTVGSICFFDQYANANQGEVFLISPCFIAKLIQKDANSFYVIDLINPIETTLSPQQESPCCLYGHIGRAHLCVHSFAQLEIGSSIDIKSEFYSAVSLVARSQTIGTAKLIAMGEKTGLQIMTLNGHLGGR